MQTIAHIKSNSTSSMCAERAHVDAPFLKFPNSRTCLSVRQSRTGKISRLFKKAPRSGQYAGECLVPALLS